MGLLGIGVSPKMPHPHPTTSAAMQRNKGQRCKGYIAKSSTVPTIHSFRLEYLANTHWMFDTVLAMKGE